MFVFEDLLLVGHDFASTGNRTPTFRYHALSFPFLCIMGPGRSNHVFSKGDVPLIPTRSVTQYHTVSHSVTSLKNGISAGRLACRLVHPQGSRVESWTLEGPKICPETPVRNYRYSLSNHPAESNSQLLGGESLTSCTFVCTHCTQRGPALDFDREYH
jgi:hypothetical protein